ncbi:MAG TPA: MBL fold metallo-hydrolase [Longimicrobiales bacterium]|nr:MBL fold metallo-hydrolase [Longimicrobiales bacterium]
MMRVTVLGSGSAGNATLVEAEGVRVLIDAGFSGRDLAARLESVEIPPESLQAILITHDHGDHSRGMGVLARRYGVPLYLTPRTAAACARLLSGREVVRSYQAERPLRIGPLEVQPFLTVHDAADPIAITIRHVASGCRMGIATDLGRPTAAVRAALAGCHLLVLEANHDDAMLWQGPYPWSVKQRIASSHGHLSNRAAAELAQELHHTALGCVVLAHLSEHCNVPALAREVLGIALERIGYRGALSVAGPARPLAPIDVMEIRRKVGATSEQLTLL